METYVRECIDLAITAWGNATNSFDVEHLRESLWNQVLGEDGILSFPEADDVANFLENSADYSLQYSEY